MEPLLAKTAREEFDIKMTSLVISSVPVGYESLPTKLAGEWLFLGVGSNVVNKTGSVLQLFQATSVRTLVWQNIFSYVLVASLVILVILEVLCLICARIQYLIEFSGKFFLKVCGGLCIIDYEFINN